MSAKATATTVQADNKIVVAGFASNGSDDDFALARYNPDGTLDSTFTAGTTTTAIGTSDDHANAMLIATDGTILAAGSTQTTDCTNSPYTTFALARYQPGPPGQAPTITSSNGTAFTAGLPASFTITTTGIPVPTVELSGTLPAGVTFQDNGDGTATLQGAQTAPATSAPSIDSVGVERRRA